MCASYIFLLNPNRNIEELPDEIREKPDYHFRTLTNEHIMKLFLLQNMKNGLHTYSPVFLCWDDDIDLDDMQGHIHAKLFSILKYTSDKYGIFHRRIKDMTEMDRKLIKEQKNYKNNSN
jgi:hypothetical protein